MNPFILIFDRLLRLSHRSRGHQHVSAASVNFIEKREKHDKDQEPCPSLFLAPQLRAQISARLGTPSKEEAGEKTSGNPESKPRKSDNRTSMSATAADTADSQAEPQDVEDGEGGEGEGDTLDGVELLDSCDRLEQDNLRLRERLEKIELLKFQREHESEKENDKMDSHINQVPCVSVR